MRKLGLEDRIGDVATEHVIFLFILYAKGILPLLIPLSVTLMEPPGWRRAATAILTAPGTLLCAWIVYAVVAYPSRTGIAHHSIVYHNAMTNGLLISATYVLATCGALLLSSHRVVCWFGIMNIIGLTVVMLVKGYAFTSVWCLYAAILSIMLYCRSAAGTLTCPGPTAVSSRIKLDERNVFRHHPERYRRRGARHAGSRLRSRR